MVCWDDLVSEYPLWRIKVAADTVDKPLFNAELHLYNDTYNYRPSTARSRYRYFTSALLGEYLSASFAWGQWQRPPMAAIHAATPGVLGDLRRLEPALRRFHQADLSSRLRVLVTESNYYGPWHSPERDAPLARLNAAMGTLGRPWRFVLEDDLGGVRDGTLVVCSEAFATRTARAVMELPRAVRVVAVDAAPALDERGLPLPTALAGAVRARCSVVQFDGLAAELGYAEGLPAEYRRTGDLGYLRWTEQRGHFEEQGVSCLLEARQVGNWVAVVNHTIEPQTAPLPWGGETAVVTFAPLEVRVYEVP
ncbi:MAG: hypothetical protein HYU66_19290 [Armatimonadetes bacterium]|nr:hypothetical protein [Armatimonadota bacterium]